jgi:hypothetical protein
VIFKDAKKEILFWQLMAVGIAVYAVFKYQKYLKGGGQAINGMNLNVDPEKVVDLASKFVPHEWRPQARNLGSIILNKVMED